MPLGALFQRRDEARDLLERRGQVGVPVADESWRPVAGGQNARPDGLRLAAIGRQAEDAQAVGPPAHQLLEPLQGAISAAVVHEQEVDARSASDEGGERVGIQALRLVEAGHDDDGPGHGVRL